MHLQRLTKLVAFRDQDLADLPIQEALDFGGYFGRHHIHPTSGAPPGYPEIHLVHRGAGDNSLKDFFKEETNSVRWHSDVTYENQPPGTTFLVLLDGPKSGGDTLFVNQVQAYNRLSTEFQKRLQGLQAVHSGKFNNSHSNLRLTNVPQPSNRLRTAKDKAELSVANQSLPSTLSFEPIQQRVKKRSS